MSSFTPALDPNEPIANQIDIIKNYGYLLIRHNRKFYPVKRINQPSSRFSNAKFIKATSPILKNFAPKVVYDAQVLGDVHYQVWDNTIVIPANFSHSAILSV